jgi:hypothetical protein
MISGIVSLIQASLKRMIAPFASVDGQLATLESRSCTV